MKRPRIIDNYVPTAAAMETAVEVLRHSKTVKRWLEGEADTFGMDINSIEGKKFVDKRGRELAFRLLRQDRVR